MTEWEYKALDHKYNNLRRWFEAMKKNHPDGLNSVVLLDKIIGKNGMFECLENTEEALFKIPDEWFDANGKIKFNNKE